MEPMLQRKPFNNLNRKEGENNMEDEIKNEGEAIQETTGQWLQDNLRIIISILIVVAIAGGIYSYSKRSEAPTFDEQQFAQEETVSDGAITKIDSETEKIATPEKVAVLTTSSQETTEAFVETAGKGDSLTVLARHALANHLEKNQDSALTAEHKIYIEDYLRKNVSHKGGIRVGTSVEFSKSLIQDAIAKSKNLNEKQLKNLHKYAVRVPSLS